MHYSSLTATKVTYTRQPMTNELVLLVYWSVRQKLNRVNSIQFSYVARYTPIKMCKYMYRPVTQM